MNNPIKSGRDLFIVDNSVSGWTGLRYLEEWTSIAKAFDIATGYFEIGALLGLDGKWQALEKIRILMGAEMTLRTRKALLDAVRERAVQILDGSIEANKEANPFLHGVPAILDALGNAEAPELTSRYLAFVWYAFNTETRRFRNFMDYNRRWIEESGSDDSHGRALWALGTLLGRSNTPSLHSMAGRLFEQSLSTILETTSPRAWAFTLIGIHEYLRRFAGDRRAGQVREDLAGRLLRLYQSHRTDEWHWFEPGLTYCNAALPHALLMCGQCPDRLEWILCA